MNWWCGDCGGVIHWIESPTGGWWAHEEHPEDEHDAWPVPLTRFFAVVVRVQGNGLLGPSGQRPPSEMFLNGQINWGPGSTDSKMFAAVMQLVAQQAQMQGLVPGVPVFYYVGDPEPKPTPPPDEGE